MHICVYLYAHTKNLTSPVSLTNLSPEGFHCFLVTPVYLYRVQMKAVILHLFYWKVAWVFFFIQLFQQANI